MTRRTSKRRTKIPVAVESQILLESRRRCCLCFHLRDELKANLQGQIAHIDQDRSNHRPENLAYLCIPCHDTYDSTTSQSKSITPQELLHAKVALLECLKGKTEANAISITVTIDNRQAQFTSEQRAQLVMSLVPSLSTASATELPDSGGRIHYTVSLAADDAERLCKQFNARELPREIVDVRISRPLAHNVKFHQVFTTEKNGVPKQEAYDSITSYSCAMYFDYKIEVTIDKASCALFTKRYDGYTVITIASVENQLIQIYASVRAIHQVVGNLYDLNPRQCLEQFLAVFGLPVAMLHLPRALYYIGETVLVPPSLIGHNAVYDYLTASLNPRPNERFGIICALSYTFPSTVIIRMFFCFSRLRYLQSVRTHTKGA